MNRRNFLKTSSLSSTGALAAASLPAALAETAGAAAVKHSFKLKYAPHFNMFKNSAGDDPVDQLKFAAERGFTAWEDNRFKTRPVEEQDRIAGAMKDLGMEWGVHVAHGSIGKQTFTIRDEDVWNGVLKEIEESVEVATRCGFKWMTVVPGNLDESPKSRLEIGYQTANVIELLKRCAALFEPHGLVMVLEPLNWHTNHGGAFLERSDQAYALCKAVNSPSCKILFDIYHQQITEGNLIPNIDLSWDEIGYFQIGDNPGRKEPGTGEINYRGVLKHIYDRMKAEGRDFIFGMEHGNSMKGVEGEEAVIAAYVDADDFEV
ncbi:MAG: TIM barrel protein [Verrucomicrobiales bacterium]|nr:TIM barrel protein [Verrucomicrobiales bacterium]